MDFDPALLQRLPFDMADYFIEKFDLHKSWPVDLAPLYQALSIRIYRDITLPDDRLAFSAFHTRQGHGVTVFTSGLEGESLTHAMGHEMGHLLYHKMGHSYGCIVSPQGVVLEQETEADWLGSYLMVPGRAFYHLSKEGYDLDQIATMLKVPREMLQMRAAIMIARDELANW